MFVCVCVCFNHSTTTAMQEEVDVTNQQIQGEFNCSHVISIRTTSGLVLTRSAITRSLLKGKTNPTILDQCEQRPKIMA